jgi:hypothetical protein
MDIIEQLVLSFDNALNSLFNGELLEGFLNGTINNSQLIDISFLIVLLAIIIFIITIIIRLIIFKKSKEELIAQKIIKKVLTLDLPSTKKNIEKENKKIKSQANSKMEIKENELTLKEMLIKKFKPKIEEQLHTDVTIIDFNAKKESFFTTINVQGHKLKLILDSSGKIIDYENLEK